ncbi:hypothetical protein KQI84_04100 [bacterium]|nr:hypothetical protein [bacterium]
MRIFPYALPGAAFLSLLIAAVQASQIRSRVAFVVTLLLAVAALIDLAAQRIGFRTFPWLVQPIWVFAVSIAVIGLAVLWFGRRWPMLLGITVLLIAIVASSFLGSSQRYAGGAYLEGSLVFSNCQWVPEVNFPLIAVSTDYASGAGRMYFIAMDGEVEYADLSPGEWRLAELYSQNQVTLLHSNKSITEGERLVDVLLYNLEDHSSRTIAKDLPGSAFPFDSTYGDGTWSPNRRILLTRSLGGESSNRHFILTDLDLGTSITLPGKYVHAVWITDNILALNETYEDSYAIEDEENPFIFCDLSTGEFLDGEDYPQYVAAVDAKEGPFILVQGGPDRCSFSWHHRRTGETRPLPRYHYSKDSFVFFDAADDFAIYPAETENGIELIAASPEKIVALLPLSDDIVVVMSEPSPDRTKCILASRTAPTPRGSSRVRLQLWDLESGALRTLAAFPGMCRINGLGFRGGKSWNPDGEHVVACVLDIRRPRTLIFEVD